MTVGGAGPRTIRDSLVASPLSHGRFLHGTSSRGYVVIGQKTGLKPPHDWDQYSEPFEKLAETLPAYGGSTDIYVSLNRFYGSRRNLAELCCLYTDLDFYKVPDLDGVHPLEVLRLAFEALERAKIPRPSIAISTGRGLELIWRHEAVPKHVQRKWGRCQDRIYEALKHLGADASAKDAARVMRLVGTYNSKSGTLVETLWHDSEEEIWDFGRLADEILPLTRDELEYKRARRREEKAQKGTRKAPRSQTDNPKGLTLRTLHEKRLSDLYRLMSIRGQSKLPAGRRDDWMFVAGTTLSHLVEPSVLKERLIELGSSKAGWGETETLSSMQSVIALAYDAAAGKTVEWSGQKRDPRYRLTTPRIIQILGITPVEQNQMEVLISGATKRRRKNERREQKRRDQGVRPRSEFIADARERKQHNRQRARELRAQVEGISNRTIAKMLGISHTEVGRLLGPR